jgi:hypothetical protein
MQVASSRTASAAQTQFPKEDLVRRNRSWLLTQSPPRSIANQIYWVRGNFQLAAGTGISNSVPSELNFSFAFSDLVDNVGLATYFDQYCIYSVVITVTANYIASNTNSTGFGTCTTAIDFDNVTPLGSYPLIVAYESAQTTELTLGTSIQRLIHPCVAQAVYSGSAFSNFAVSRTWIDSTNTSTPHYGFRSIFVNNGVAGFKVDYNASYIVGLRNNI